MSSISSRIGEPCPSPGKRKYETSAQALADLRRINRARSSDPVYRAEHRQKAMDPVRVYFCSDGCGYWHLTASRRALAPDRERWPDSMRPGSGSYRQPREQSTADPSE